MEQIYFEGVLRRVADLKSEATQLWSEINTYRCGLIDITEKENRLMALTPFLHGATKRSKAFKAWRQRRANFRALLS